MSVLFKVDTRGGVYNGSVYVQEPLLIVAAALKLVACGSVQPGVCAISCSVKNNDMMRMKNRINKAGWISEQLERAYLNNAV